MPTRPIPGLCVGAALRAWSQGVGVGTCPPPELYLKEPGDRRWWLTAIPLEDAENKEAWMQPGTRVHPGPVENKNGDGAPCPIPLLVYQGNNPEITVL